MGTIKIPCCVFSRLSVPLRFRKVLEFPDQGALSRQRTLPTLPRHPSPGRRCENAVSKMDAVLTKVLSGEALTPKTARCAQVFAPNSTQKVSRKGGRVPKISLTGGVTSKVGSTLR